MIVCWRCLLHVCCIACCLRSLSCPLIETPFLSSHILHWNGSWRPFTRMPAYAARHLIADQYSCGWTPTSRRSATASTAATPTNIGTSVRAGHIGPTNLSNGANHSCGHLRQADGTSRSCSSGECQHVPRTQTEKKIPTPGPSSASVTQPQPPQASSWPPCPHWFHV